MEISPTGPRVAKNGKIAQNGAGRLIQVSPDVIFAAGESRRGKFGRLPGLLGLFFNYPQAANPADLDDLPIVFNTLVAWGLAA